MRHIAHFINKGEQIGHATAKWLHDNPRGRKVVRALLVFVIFSAGIWIITDMIEKGNLARAIGVVVTIAIVAIAAHRKAQRGL